jgi:hypothetical protein
MLKIHDVIHPALASHLYGIIGAAVVYDQPLYGAKPLYRSRESA